MYYHGLAEVRDNFLHAGAGRFDDLIYCFLGSKFMSRYILVFTGIILSGLSAALPALSNDDCRGLLSETDVNLSVVSAEVIAATDKLPTHCRVHGFILSAVNFELRLPPDWNGKFFMVGNGGYLGEFFDQSYGLARGYATASTDTGHSGPDPRFAYNNRAAEIDFAFRSIHVTAQAAKRLIEAFYGSSPEYSYFRGCSTGGRQALMEAQRFPDDFDGWSIGAPIYDYTYKQIYNAAWVAQALYGNDRDGYVPKSKLKTLGKAVYQRCDAIDGLDDGLIDDPRLCDFDPARDLRQCPRGRDGRDCFTAAQIEALAKIYAGPGEDVYPGAIKGGEWLEAPDHILTGGWDVYFTGMEDPAADAEHADGRNAYGGGLFTAVQLRNASSFFKYLAFEVDQPDYDVLADLDFENVPDVSFMAKMMNATDADLSAVHGDGKKILLWHGWADVGLNPIRTIQYYEQVREQMGGKTVAEFMRLFMVPGMYHCDGGPGPDLFDDLTALENWVERGEAPEQMTAYKTRGANDFYPHRAPSGRPDLTHVTRTRPLCAYPKVARYTGKGSIDQAENFRCVDP